MARSVSMVDGCLGTWGVCGACAVITPQPSHSGCAHLEDRLSKHTNNTDSMSKQITGESNPPAVDHTPRRAAAAPSLRPGHACAGSRRRWFSMRLRRTHVGVVESISSVTRRKATLLPVRCGKLGDNNQLVLAQTKNPELCHVPAAVRSGPVPSAQGPTLAIQPECKHVDQSRVCSMRSVLGIIFQCVGRALVGRSERRRSQ